MAALKFEYSNETVVVTGASRGIGYGIAKAFSNANANVIILASGKGIDDAAASLSKETGRIVIGYQCDVTDAARVTEVMAKIGKIDVLIANAGLERITPITDRSKQCEDTFRRIIDINVIGTYLITREAVHHMSANGRIVITSSVWGKSAIGEFSAYIASKHANIGFMRSLARELGPKGIRVNCVCPGWVKTEAAMLSLKRMSEHYGRAEEDILAEIVATQCFDGLQEPDDVADPYLYLASDLAKNITGQSINVDRGEFLG